MGGLRNSDLRSDAPLVVLDVTPGSAIDAAGLRIGDTIRYSHADGFYKSLAFGRGSTVGVPVQRGRQRLAVQIAVPQVPLPVDPAQVRWACPDSVVPAAAAMPAKPRGWQ